ncbi:F-box family protein, partial [Striga asiatica]
MKILSLNKFFLVVDLPLPFCCCQRFPGWSRKLVKGGCVERQHDDDVISRLPDDILLVILSSLPLKEAGRTSVLSSRWRNLWSYTSYLYFDDYSTMEKIIQEAVRTRVFRSLERERESFARWVDSVLQPHRGFSLKELRICFSLSQSPSITKWLEFAFTRHIEKLELNFSGLHIPDESYVLTQELLRENSGIFNYKTLKVLCLDCINVSGEAIEFLLRYCPLLEQILGVWNQKVKIFRPKKVNFELRSKKMELLCLNKCGERYHGDDFISLLPDDILLVILSSLPLKEVGRTSVLSSRWRNLWSCTSYLYFDDYSSLEKIIQDPDSCTLKREREKYVRWVDSVLQSHRGFSLKELRICFNLNQSPSITKWLEFAFERHIEKLELNLSDVGYGYESDETYVFPQELLRENSRIFNYKTLKALCLDCTNVSGEAIEFLLRYCPLLEQI